MGRKCRSAEGHTWGNYAKHPDFDVYWEKYCRFVWWVARKVSNRTRYGRPSDFVGYLTIRFNRALFSYRPELGSFTNYFFYNSLRDCITWVLRWESESWDLSWHKKISKALDEKLEVIHNTYADHASCFYHIPSTDTWMDEIRKCFSCDEDLWRYVLKGLTKRSADVIFRYYKRDESLEMIGKDLGVSKERVRQIRETGLRKIRERVGELESWNKIFKVRKAELGPYFPGDIFTEPPRVVKDQKKRGPKKKVVVELTLTPERFRRQPDGSLEWEVFSGNGY